MRAHSRPPLQRGMGPRPADGLPRLAVRENGRPVPARAQARHLPGGRAGAQGHARYRARARHPGARGRRDRGRARPVAGGHDPVQAARVRGLRHRSGRGHFAHRHRRTQPQPSGDRRAASRARADSRKRAAHRRRPRGRAHRQPRRAGAGRVPAAQPPVRGGAAQAEAAAQRARHHARRGADRASRQHRATPGHRRGPGGGRNGHRAFPHRVPVSQPRRSAGRRRAVRGLPAGGGIHARNAGDHPLARPGGRQGSQRGRALGTQSGARPARDPVLSRRTADVPHAAARDPEGLPVRARAAAHPHARPRARGRAVVLGPGAGKSRAGRRQRSL